MVRHDLDREYVKILEDVIATHVLSDRLSEFCVFVHDVYTRTHPLGDRGPLSDREVYFLRLAFSEGYKLGKGIEMSVKREVQI